DQFRGNRYVKFAVACVRGVVESNLRLRPARLDFGVQDRVGKTAARAARCADAAVQSGGLVAAVGGTLRSTRSIPGLRCASSGLRIESASIGREAGQVPGRHFV